MSPLKLHYLKEFLLPTTIDSPGWLHGRAPVTFMWGRNIELLAFFYSYEYGKLLFVCPVTYNHFVLGDPTEASWPRLLEKSIKN